MTRRRDAAAGGRRGAAACWPSCFAPVLHAGRQDVGAPPREGDHASIREENLRDDRGLGRLPARARASAWSTTPSTSSTPTATTPPTRCAACARPPRPAPRTSTLCDTNGAIAAGATSRRPPRAWWRSSATRCRSASTPTTTPAAAWPTRCVAVEHGARQVQGTMNGYGERCGNANLVSILPGLQLKLGFECVAAGAARAPDRDRAPGRRDLQLHAGPQPALRGRATRSPTRAACTWPA